MAQENWAKKVSRLLNELEIYERPQLELTGLE
jgi:hypothetical protein